MTRLTIVQHHPAEGPGGIAGWAASRGVALDIVRADLGEMPARDCAALVLLGGPASVDDHTPWVRDERRWLRALPADVAVLGICLGAQLLADASGGRVRKLRAAETGWTAVEFAAGGEPIEFLQWHGDTYTLPPGAQRLAGSAHCAQQMFALGTHRIGMQFHPEWTAESVAALHAHFGAACPLPRVACAHRHAAAQRWLEHMLDGWRRASNA